MNDLESMRAAMIMQLLLLPSLSRDWVLTTFRDWRDFTMPEWMDIEGLSD